MKKALLILFFGCCFGSTSFGQTFFAYDASGNMTSRSITVRSARTIRPDSIVSIKDSLLAGDSKKMQTPSPNEIKYDRVGNLSFSIYPNPTAGRLTIDAQHDGKLPKTSLMIYDLQGRLIRQMNQIQTSQTIDLSEEKAGTYILRLQNENKTIDWKIIKN